LHRGQKPRATLRKTDGKRGNSRVSTRLLRIRQRKSVFNKIRGKKDKRDKGKVVSTLRIGKNRNSHLTETAREPNTKYIKETGTGASRSGSTERTMTGKKPAEVGR